MIKKLENAVAELEKRTNTRMHFCDYDDIQGGIQSMSSGNRYALWLYATMINNEYTTVGTQGKVLGRFRTQAEAFDNI